MTPQEAVDFLVRTGVNRNDRAELRRIFESVAAMAKAEETRRCAALARQTARTAEGTSAGKLFANFAEQLFRTGGLEVEAH